MTYDESLTRHVYEHGDITAELPVFLLGQLARLSVVFGQHLLDVGWHVGAEWHHGFCHVHNEEARVARPQLLNLVFELTEAGVVQPLE